MTLNLLTVILVSASWLFAADVPKPMLQYSPDRSALVGWLDVNAGSPVGPLRSIFFRQTADEWLFFSRVTIPRMTQAAWNSTSTRCVLADAPDNGNLLVWLIEKHPESPLWRPITLDPLASLERQFGATPHGATLWRPSILHMKWTDEFTLQLRCYCNLGTYLLTLDARAPTEKITIQHLSDKLLE